MKREKQNEEIPCHPSCLRSDPRRVVLCHCRCLGSSHGREWVKNNARKDVEAVERFFSQLQERIHGWSHPATKLRAVGGR